MAQPALTVYSVGPGQPIHGGRWPGGQLAGNVALDAAAVAGAFSVAESSLSGAVGLAGVEPGGGIAGVATPYELLSDGAWTWCDTIINAVERNGSLYLQTVDKAGTNWITKRVIATGVTSSTQLGATALEPDDHNAGSILFDSVGRIISMYGMHNDPIFRSKRSLAAESIAAFTVEGQRGTGSGPYAYPHMFRLSQMPLRTWYLCRRWYPQFSGDGSGSTRTLALRTSDTLDALSDANWNTNTWSGITDLWKVDDCIPYWQLADDGVKRLHVVAIDKHPVQGQNSLYHFYMELDGSNVPHYFRSDGSEIMAAGVPKAPPFGPADATLIYDGSAVRCWAYDLVLDSDGFPRVLFCKYPGNGSHTAPIEYWHAKWDGAHWVESFICMDDKGLYIPEVYYAGALSFAREVLDPTKIFLSAPIAGVRQIQAWRSSDDGESDGGWGMTSQITQGGGVGAPLNFRPIVPRDRVVGPRVLWLSGTYNNFYGGYDLRVMALD